MRVKKPRRSFDPTVDTLDLGSRKGRPTARDVAKLAGTEIVHPYASNADVFAPKTILWVMPGATDAPQPKRN